MSMESIRKGKQINKQLQSFEVSARAKRTTIFSPHFSHISGILFGEKNFYVFVILSLLAPKAIEQQQLQCRFELGTSSHFLYANLICRYFEWNIAFEVGNIFFLVFNGPSREEAPRCSASSHRWKTIGSFVLTGIVPIKALPTSSSPLHSATLNLKPTRRCVYEAALSGVIGVLVLVLLPWRAENEMQR